MLETIIILVMIVLSLFSLILGNDFIASAVNIEVDNIAIVNGATTTLLIEGQSIIFQIDTSSLILAGIAVLVSVAGVAIITGVQVLGSGLNAESAKILIILSAYTGIWTALSLITFSLINSIAIFGGIIYIGLTVGYAFGVIKKLTGSE